MLFDSSSRRIRVSALQILVLTSIAFAIARTAIADPRPAFPRVRSSSAFVRDLMEEAARRSPTFRRLADAIAATDGIVYVEPGTWVLLLEQGT